MDFTSAVAFLLLNIVMPNGKPDITSPPIPQTSIEECQSEAKKFLDHGVTVAMHEKGAVAVAAGCMIGYKVGT